MFWLKNGEYDTNKIYQGDIINDFPFFLFPEDNYKLLQEIEPRNYRLEDNREIPNTDFLGAVDVKLSTVAVLSQTCDIENRDFVVVAPVFELAGLIQSGHISDSGAGLLRNRKEGKYGYLFYLEPNGSDSFSESVIDFQQMHYFSKQMLFELRENRVLVMSDWGRHHLGWKLSSFFGRPIEKK